MTGKPDSWAFRAGLPKPVVGYHIKRLRRSSALSVARQTTSSLPLEMPERVEYGPVPFLTETGEER